MAIGHKNVINGGMNISEHTMWGRIRKALKGLDPIRVENKCELGTPDVNYIEGWIELKWCRKLPKKGKILTLTHDMTKEQRTWAIRRSHAGGKTFVFLKCGNIWILLKGYVAAEILGKVTVEELCKRAEKTWKIKLNDRELREILMKH